MTFRALDRLEVSPWRIAVVGLAAGAGAGGAVLSAGGALGDAREATALVVGVLAAYVVVSTPRRVVEGGRLSQARESALLSASASACLAVTGSRSRTLLLLRARDHALAASLREAARRVLLGTRVERALEDSAGRLESYSAAASLVGLASSSPGGIDQGDEETRGLESSSELSLETKIPMLMTACFFTPILLLLYAVFARVYSIEDIAELAFFEFIVLDLASYFSSAEKAPA